MLRGIISLFAAGAGAWALSAADGIGQSNPFRQLLGQQTEERTDTSIWFERADGNGRFILDRTMRPALLWQEGGREVIALYRAPASGGGQVWLSDTDRTVLRESNLGGWTYFPPDARDGVIVEPLGRARTLVAAPAGGDELQAAARDMVDTLAGYSRNEVSAQLTSLTQDQNPYIIDAMAMVVMGADQASRRSMRDLEVIRIGVGEAPRVSYDGRTLDISVATHMGYGGRPSSEYIRRAIDAGGR
ncbi:DUF4908 domain-containing protein [Maricaulaceae bacterium EIL42A08]|nr:DUF4908 domain-containing protein [Maricaulaceae bacterium EIL42A08]MCP2678064.1 DUF4908 domain-containing protein [Maricaulaceae bacterium NA33B04]